MLMIIIMIIIVQEYFSNMDKATLQDSLNNRRGVFGSTPRSSVCFFGNKSKVINYLKQKGANVNAKANSGYTTLHLAASAGHIDCVNTCTLRIWSRHWSYRRLWENSQANCLAELEIEHREWSPCLVDLDLSNNELSSLPNDMAAPSIRSLLIAGNNFNTIP